jgi:hypothetical protein
MRTYILTLSYCLFFGGCEQAKKTVPTKLYTYKIYIDGKLVKNRGYGKPPVDTFRLPNDSSAYDKGASELMNKRAGNWIYEMTAEKFKDVKYTPDSGRTFKVVDYRGVDLKPYLPKKLTDSIERYYTRILAESKYQTKIEMEYKKIHPDADDK